MDEPRRTLVQRLTTKQLQRGAHNNVAELAAYCTAITGTEYIAAST